MLGEIATAFQQTLKTTIGCRGIGLHSGCKVAMTLHPAPPDTGIVFRRTGRAAEIRADWVNTIDSPLCTTLSNGEGVSIGTVEHLMAALAGDHGFSMSFEIDFDNPLIRRQEISLVFDADTFKTELSRARTFGLLEEVDRLRAAGFARGGSLDNAVVVGGDQVLNVGGLRYGDEFVRHKLLDAFGDLYLAGGPLIGAFHGVRSGHRHTRRLLAALFTDSAAWCYTTLGRATGIPGLGQQDELKL